MDMNITLNTLPQNVINTNYNTSEIQKDRPIIEDNNNKPKIKTDVPEKVMMDLKDVQNFLYMLIGSELKVESENNSPGSTINRTA